MQHLFFKKYLSQDAFLGVSVLPKPGGSPLDHRRKPPAISSGHRHFKRTGFKLLQSWTESFFRTSHVHPSVHLTNYSSPTLFFGVKYDDAPSRLYTFLQTTLYNIDIGTTDETPRVKELRAKLLNKL